MKKTGRLVLFFTVISNLIIIYAVVASGINEFLIFWNKISLKYTIGIILMAGIWYFIWITRINKKGEFADISTYTSSDLLNLNDDKDFLPTQCPECEEECWYESKDPNATLVLTCWNCQHLFSYVWCEKSGMGGDFIEKITHKPSSWECPDCHTAYPISGHVFENPKNTVSYKQLPTSVVLSNKARQYRFQKEQAATSVIFLSTMLIGFSLVPPVVNALEKAFSQFVTITEANSPLLYSCGAFLFFLFSFVAMWYGLVMSLLWLFKKIKAVNEARLKAV